MVIQRFYLLKVAEFAFQRTETISTNDSYEPTAKTSLSHASASTCVPNAK
jgi:hypothetical protein